MRNQVRKFIVGVSLVAALSMTVPAMATTSDDDGSGSILSRFKDFIVHLLDVDEGKLTFPPG